MSRPSSRRAVPARRAGRSSRSSARWLLPAAGWRPVRVRGQASPALLVLLVLLTSLITLPAPLTPLAPSPAAAAGSPTPAPDVVAASAAPSPQAVLDPSTAVAGELVRVAGRLPGGLARPVLVQRRSGRGWVTVARLTSSASGSYEGRFAAPQAGRHRLRVLGPPVGRGRSSRPVRSSPVALSVVGQSAGLRLPATVPGVGAPTAQASFVPARPGRPVHLQVLTAGGWTTVRSSAQSSVGTAALGLPEAPLGRWSYRAVTSAWRGAPAWSSPVRSTTHTPSAPGGAGAPAPPTAVPGAGGPVPVAPAAPSGLSALSGRDGQVPLSWSPVTGATSYVVRFRVQDAPSWSASAAVTAATDTVTGLEDGTVHEFQVQARGAGGGSPWSATVTAVPSAPPPAAPVAPTLLTATSGADRQVPLTWAGSAGAASFQVRWRSRGAGSWTAEPAVTGASTTVTGLSSGTAYEFQVRARGAGGDSPWSASQTATPGCGTCYAEAVLADGATGYWRLDQVAGTGADLAGGDDLVIGAGVASGTAGALHGSAGTAVTLDGTWAARASSSQAGRPGPDTFTVEAWFRTTTAAGGRIVGFGSSASGTSTQYDRHVYLDDDGRLWFGVHPGEARTVSSGAAYADGQWHHVVASLSPAGMALYVDGQRVARDTSVTAGEAYQGYWRIGADRLSGWPSRPTSDHFAGAVDEVAVYPTALTPAQVQQHYTSSGRTLAP